MAAVLFVLAITFIYAFLYEWWKVNAYDVIKWTEEIFFTFASKLIGYTVVEYTIQLRFFTMTKRDYLPRGTTEAEIEKRYSKFVREWFGNDPIEAVYVGWKYI